MTSLVTYAETFGHPSGTRAKNISIPVTLFNAGANPLKVIFLAQNLVPAGAAIAAKFTIQQECP